MDQLLCASLSRHPLLEQGTCAIQKMSEAFVVCYIIYIMYKDNDGVLPVVLLLARPLPYYASIPLVLTFFFLLFCSRGIDTRNLT